MKRSISHFFIDRPAFAMVISIVITIVGIVGYFRLPVAQYPNVVPPFVVVRTSYPGASPEILMDTVVAPLDQEINGVENMLYMASQCSSDGSILITITFEVGTNLDIAQVQVQNRVAIATPRLPEEVRNIGVVVKKTLSLHACEHKRFFSGRIPRQTVFDKLCHKPDERPLGENTRSRRPGSSRVQRIQHENLD